MSSARIYKVANRLADAVDVRFGLKLDAALARAHDAVREAQDGMMVSLREWVDEIEALCEQPEPDRARLAWLANGVLGVAGACGLGTLSRCGGLFGRAIELMSEHDDWRSDMALVYATALGRMLEGADRAAEEAAVLVSLEAMNQRLSAPPQV
ncbi:hypothetical protein [Caulobacter mirabilis]|uniref:Chemotaxis protein CheE n=1 Tax=Caulobacter mirabilis TaxID=69666 RepID=A0A2D2B1P2_9CAUL|nr:hypothetical protein [Caulobacter mirabilis]ATQ44182.1 hypothetical protein CSW64_18210 [Caulobacter mirabilis]